MVSLFCNTDGIHDKSDANSADKWNFTAICTDMNGMRSLPHGASHGEWKIYAKKVYFDEEDQVIMKMAVERDEKRIKNIDRLIKSLYEDKVLGELEDDRYSTLMTEYEKEQRELIASVAAMRKTLESTDQKAVDLRLLLKTLRELTDVNELTPTIVNSLIDRIEVHNNDKSGGHCYVKVDIYFSAVGMIDIPTAEEIRAMIEEIKKDPLQFRYVA